MNKNALIAIVVILLAVGAFLVFGNQNGNENQNENQNTQGANTQNPTPPPTTPTPSPTTPTPSPTPSGPVEISITSAGFSPNMVTVKKGTAVVFKNNDTKGRWPASAPHPSHTDYPAFDPKAAIAAGASWSFTFDRVGTWAFHDHLLPTQFGRVIVTE